MFGSKQLVEFSFVSRISPSLGAAGLLRLARQSWSFNSKMGLTGTLRLVDGEFSEVIEGPCEVVQPLAGRILGDDRHGSIRILAFHRLDARRHETWRTSGFDLGDKVGNHVATAGVGRSNVAIMTGFRPARRPSRRAANVDSRLA